MWQKIIYCCSHKKNKERIPVLELEEKITNPLNH